MTRSTSPDNPRRSSRVLVALPLTVSGQKSDGVHISGDAETVMVNRHGARIRSMVGLEAEMELRVSLLTPYKWRAAKVIWANPGQNEYGIELYRAENFWGVHFPPEDWESNLPPVVVFKEPARVQLKNAAREKEHGEINVPKAGIQVTLRGQGDTDPFQAQGILIPLGEHHGAMLVNELAGLGSSVSVIFSKDQVEDAVIAAIAHSREDDCWRIWLQFVHRLRFT
jgi:hypothetical protein